MERWTSPVDWGAPEVRGPDRATRCLRHVDALLGLHAPDVLVLQDTSKTGTRRAPRIRALNRRTLQLAKRHGVPVHTYSRGQVLDYFEKFGAQTKQSIAETIAKHTPALSLYLPPARKPCVTGGAFPRKVGGENRTETAGRRPWWPRMAGLQPLSTRAFGPRLRRLTALTALATRPLIATKRSTARCGQSVCKCHAEKFRSAIFARVLTAVHIMNRPTKRASRACGNQVVR